MGLLVLVLHVPYWEHLSTLTSMTVAPIYRSDWWLHLLVSMAFTVIV